MKKVLNSIVLASILAVGGFATIGCEVSHSESDKPTWFGGTKHEETTVTRNPVTGDTNVSHSEQRTNP
jgi:hypothetical protein